MKTFLGVPVLLRSVAYGNLYLTEKREGEFTQEDEDLIGLLASQAAVAIENARLYESATRWSRQLESLIEVGNALSGEIELPRVLQLVTDKVSRAHRRPAVFIALPLIRRLLIQAASGETAASFVGAELPTSAKSVRVLERRRSERVDSLIDDPEVDQEFTRRLGARTGLFVPLIVRGQPIGVVMAHDREGTTRGSPTRICASPRRSRSAPPSPPTSPRESRGMRLRVSSMRRSSSANAWPASCTTRRDSR